MTEQVNLDKKGELTTIVRSSRRLVVGALLSPYTSLFKAYAHSRRHSSLFSATGAMISKDAFFELLVHGSLRSASVASAAAAQQGLENSASQSQLAQALSPSSVAQGSQDAPASSVVRITPRYNSHMTEDLEFLWSEITLLLAHDEDNDDDDDMFNNQDSRRRRSKKLKSFIQPRSHSTDADGNGTAADTSGPSDMSDLRQMASLASASHDEKEQRHERQRLRAAASGPHRTHDVQDDSQQPSLLVENSSAYMDLGDGAAMVAEQTDDETDDKLSHGSSSGSTGGAERHKEARSDSNSGTEQMPNPSVDDLAHDDSDDTAEAVSRMHHTPSSMALHRTHGDLTWIAERLKKAGVAPRTEVPVKDIIIRLCVASSPSPTITSEQCDAVLNILDSTSKGPTDEITRYEFLILLKRHSDASEIQKLDIEELTLHLFPDERIELVCLRQLIRSCQLPSAHHGFAMKYAEQRLKDWTDARELMFYVPFLVLYIGIVISGKFVTPRTYYGYGVTSYMNSLLFTPTFTSCTYNVVDMSLCNSTNTGVTLATSSSAVDMYQYLQVVLIPALWAASNTSVAAGIRTAAESVLGLDLHLIGALKLRNIRVAGRSEAVLTDRYFGTQGTLQYPPLSDTNVATSRHPTLDDASFRNVTLPGFSGTDYRTCEELNATGSVLGNIGTVGCYGHGVVIPINATLSDAIRVVQGLQRGAWIDESTRVLAAELMLFHPVSTLFASVKLLAEFRAGGGLAVTTHISPFTFFTFSGTQPFLSGLYIAYFAFLFFNVVRYVFLHFVLPMLSTRLSRSLFSWSGSHAASSYDRWMLVDICNYAMFLASAGARLQWMSLGSPMDNPVWEASYYPRGYEDARLYFNAMVMIDSFNILLSVIGLLRFSKFAPAMGLVVSALNRAASDAIALFLVMAGTFMSLVVCAAASFGDSVYGYHTVLWAAETMGQVFIGNYDYTPLHDIHPTFSYVLFFVFQVVIAIILMNMFIAVFTDAFSTEMSLAYDRNVQKEILDNTCQHPIARTSWWSFVINGLPAQVIRSTIARLWHFLLRRKSLIAGVDYLSFDYTMAWCFHVLFSQSEVVEPSTDTAAAGSQQHRSSSSSTAGDGGGLSPARRSTSEGSPRLRGSAIFGLSSFSSSADAANKQQSDLGRAILRLERIQSAAKLLSLLDKIHLPHVQTMSVSTASARRAGISGKSAKGATNIFDFISDQVGHDYPLVMSFFILLPQALFGIPGEYLLEACMTHFTSWRYHIKRLSLKANDDALLEIRLRAIVEERDGRAKIMADAMSFSIGINATQKAKIAQLREAQETAKRKKLETAGVTPAVAFLNKMDNFNRRLFLAILACTPIMAESFDGVETAGQDIRDGQRPSAPSAEAEGGDVDDSTEGFFTMHSGLGDLFQSSAAFEASPRAERMAHSVRSVEFATGKEIFLSRTSFKRLAEECQPLRDICRRCRDENERYLDIARSAQKRNAAEGAAQRDDRDDHDDHPDGNDEPADVFQSVKPELVTVDSLVVQFAIPESSHIRLDAFRSLILDEFGEQALSFGFTAHEYRRVERYLERRIKEKRALQVKNPEGRMPSNSIVLPDGMTSFEADSFHASVKNAIAVAAGNLMERASAMQTDASGVQSPSARRPTLPTSDAAARLGDVTSADFFVLSESEFTDAWRWAKGTAPPKQAVTRIFSLFPEALVKEPLDTVACSSVQHAGNHALPPNFRQGPPSPTGTATPDTSAGRRVVEQPSIASPSTPTPAAAKHSSDGEAEEKGPDAVEALAPAPLEPTTNPDALSGSRSLSLPAADVLTPQSLGVGYGDHRNDVFTEPADAAARTPQSHHRVPPPTLDAAVVEEELLDMAAAAECSDDPQQPALLHYHQRLRRRIDARVFLRYCQEHLFAHKNMSFARHFCDAEMRRLYSALWIAFYIPFFALTLFFLFYRNPLGETIWISTGLSSTFNPPSAVYADDVALWLHKSVQAVWPDGTSAAPPHNDANHFVGALRIRQRRISGEDCQQQYLDYFGDPVTGALRLPEDVARDASTAGWYQHRVERDFGTFQNKRTCYAAYDFGIQDSKASFGDPVALSAVCTALEVSHWRFPSQSMELTLRTHSRNCLSLVGSMLPHGWLSSNSLSSTSTRMCLVGLDLATR